MVWVPRDGIHEKIGKFRGESYGTDHFARNLKLLDRNPKILFFFEKSLKMNGVGTTLIITNAHTAIYSNMY